MVLLDDPRPEGLPHTRSQMEDDRVICVAPGRCGWRSDRRARATRPAALLRGRRRGGGVRRRPRGHRGGRGHRPGLQHRPGLRHRRGQGQRVTARITMFAAILLLALLLQTVAFAGLSVAGWRARPRPGDGGRLRARGPDTCLRYGFAAGLLADLLSGAVLRRPGCTGHLDRGLPVRGAAAIPVVTRPGGPGRGGRHGGRVRRAGARSPRQSPRVAAVHARHGPLGRRCDRRPLRPRGAPRLPPRRPAGRAFAPATPPGTSLG